LLYIPKFFLILILILILKYNHGNNSNPIKGECKNTRSIINKNPLNIKNSKRNMWVGEVKIKKDYEFEEFSSFDYGIRSAYKLLRNYNTKYGDNTINRILYRFSPPSENNTEKIINDISIKMGIRRDKPLSESDYINLIHQMSLIESGCEFNVTYIKNVLFKYKLLN
jgi:hypothetical protein